MENGYRSLVVLVWLASLVVIYAKKIYLTYSNQTCNLHCVTHLLNETDEFSTFVLDSCGQSTKEVVENYWHDTIENYGDQIRWRHWVDIEDFKS